MATKRNTKSTAKSQNTKKETVQEPDVNLTQSEAEEVQIEQEVEEPKAPQTPKKVKACLRMTWPGLGKVGEVIELSEKLAKEYVALGVVDTAPNAIRTATKSK